MDSVDWQTAECCRAYITILISCCWAETKQLGGAIRSRDETDRHTMDWLADLNYGLAWSGLARPSAQIT